MANKFLCCDNFKLVGMTELPTDIDHIKNSGMLYDARTGVIVNNLNTLNLEWYYNYIDLNRTFSIKNPKAYSIYLLDLGYVPVIYLPSCCASVGATWFSYLDRSQLQYIKMAPTSFVTKYCNMDSVDAWVSKIDAAEFLNISVESVTSNAIIRRLFDVRS